jgi:hypothetical protein
VTERRLPPGGMRLLEGALEPVIGPMIREAVVTAVDDALGVVPPAFEDSGAPILEALRSFHADELAEAEADLPQLLDDALGGGLLDEPAAMLAVEDVIRSDTGAHAVAAERFQGALREALTLPSPERTTRVVGLLHAERERMARRARTRVRRAASNLRASLRLSDEALDAPPRAA